MLSSFLTYMDSISALLKPTNFTSRRASLPESTTTYTENSSLVNAIVLAVAFCSVTTEAVPSSSMWTTAGSFAARTTDERSETLIGARGSISSPSAFLNVMSTAATFLTTFPSSRAASTASMTSSSATAATSILVPAGNAPSGATTVAVTPLALPKNDCAGSSSVASAGIASS